MKKLLVFALCCVMVLSFTCIAHAKNFDNPPQSPDQIKVGDTYDKGDGELKIFDENGKLIKNTSKKKGNISPLDSDYDNGSVGGWTDIWWYYNPLSPLTGNGPKGEAATYSYAMDGESDYLQAYLEIYVNGTKKASDPATIRDDNEITAYAEHLYYGWNGGVTLPCEGKTTHKVIDSEEGWDVTFHTDDDF